ncbi:MAG: SDR family oxidoreductase [Chloroflexi bacterium]|nr:SDR family oxidoreductase [Chloroflexota bacterium]
MTASLVTGGAGFIGSHLARVLLERGDSVRVFDNFSTGRRENLKGLEDIELIEGDLRDNSSIARAVHGIDYVYHLAAFVSVPQSMQDPQTCFEVNAGGTVGLLEAARRAGVRKVLLASSTAVYGNTDIFPTGEGTTLQPLSPYAVSKQVNELYARLYTQTMGLPVVALRFFNVYGPRQRPDSDYAAAIPIFLRCLLDDQQITIFGDGRQTRDFIYVRDVVEALLLSAASDAAGEAFNVCTGREATLLDLLEELSGIAPRQPEVRFDAPRPGDIYRSLGDPTRAEAVIGFRASTSLADGLKQTLDWMKAGR